jgi:hypothetical protein
MATRDTGGEPPDGEAPALAAWACPTPEPSPAETPGGRHAPVGDGGSVRTRAQMSNEGETVDYRVLLGETAQDAGERADAHAERGDYEEALDWLEVARTLSGGLSLADRAKRRAWRVAVLDESASRPA